MEPTNSGGFGAVQANHITAGDIGTTFVWRALGDYNQPDLVQTMIMQPSLPSYLSMINGGETTITENWNYPSTRSHDHDMYAGIFEWLYRSLGGISSSKPGYAEMSLKPGMPTGLASVSVSYNSVRGPITSAWNRAAGTVQWKVSVPVNATAKVYLPTFATAAAGVTVTESGTEIFKNGAASGSVLGRHVRSRRRRQPAGLRRVRRRFGHVPVRLERAMTRETVPEGALCLNPLKLGKVE